MPILPSTRVDYTDADFDSIRARLYNLIRSVFPDWTDESVANFGNLLIEMYANVGDMLGFYANNYARESRISTATQRRSVLSLAKLLSYVPKGATAATVDCQVTLSTPPAQNVVFAVGRQVRTLGADPVRFQVTQETTILAGANPPTATLPVEHSESREDTFASNGLASQQIRLGFSPFLDASESVEADNGTYTRVDNFLQSTSADRHYTVVVDQADVATLRFGNGISGQIPSGTITVAYKTGGGTEGNVEQNTIRAFENQPTDVLGASVQATITNPARATGGAPRESRAQIQVNAPASARVADRTVSREDYEINAKRMDGVSRALMLTADELVSIPENSGRLYIIPAGGGKPSTSMKEAVRTMVTVTYPRAPTFKLEVLDAVYKTLDVYSVVFPRKGVNVAALDSTIRADLASFFALTINAGTEDEQDNPAVNFGYYASQDSSGAFDGTLALSDVRNVVRDANGVRKLGDGISDFLVNGEHSDVSIAIHEFPVLGTVTLINGETGAPLV